MVFVDSPRGGLIALMAKDYYDRIIELPTTTVLFGEESVNDLWENRIYLAVAHKKERAMVSFLALYEIVDNLNRGNTYSEEEIAETEHWEYIKGYHKSWQEVPLSSRARNQMSRKFWDSVNLFYDIKRHGMRDPLDILVTKGKCDLYRGSRRLVILKVLGTEKARIRYAIERTSPLA